MKARTLILTITAAALIAAPGAVLAQNGPGGSGTGSCDGTGPHGNVGMRGPHGGGAFGGGGAHGLLRMLPRLADKLDLTEDQQNRIQAIVEAGRTEIEPLREQATADRDAFREDREIGDFDETTFRDHFEIQAELHVEMQLIGAELASQAFAVLNTDQQQEFLELMELFRDGRGGPRHGGGKRHGSN